MTTIAEVVKAAIPDATPEIIDWVLWERTPYPCGKVSAKKIYKASSSFVRASVSGIKQCELCSKGRVFGEGFVCSRCKKQLARYRDE